MILKVLSLCPLSMFEHKSSTFTIPETEWENMCLNLLHRDTTKCSPSLLLVCVSLIFLMMSCDKSYVKQALWLRITRPMCDGRSFASSPFRRLASRGPFLFLRRYALVFFFRIAVYLCRCIALHDPVPKRESVHASCGRPFDITSCFFHTAQRLGKCWL